MIRETKEEAKIRYTLHPIPPKARKNNATSTPDAPMAKPLGIPKTARNAYTPLLWRGSQKR